MMYKCTIVLVGVALALVQVYCDDRYTTKYDNMNIDDILKSERLLNNYVKCLMDEGACTPDGTELKKNMKEALDTDCEKCSEKQKENINKVLTYLLNHKPAVWDRLEKKYDPEGTYRAKYADRITTTPKA